MDSADQKIFPPSVGFPARINIRRLSQRHASDAVRHLVHTKLRSHGRSLAVGVACHVSNEGRVEFMALSNTDTVFCISFDEKTNVWDKGFLDLLQAGGAALGDGGPACCLVGFSMARTAVQAHRAVRQRVQGVDLASLAAPTRDGAARPLPVDMVLNSVSKSANRWEIARLWIGDENSVVTSVCLQAWLAACVGGRNYEKLMQSRKIDTNFLHPLELECVTQMALQSDIIENNKPVVSSNDFTNVTMTKEGKVDLLNSRYKSRVRRNVNAQVILTNKDGCEYVGNAQRMQGKRTTINMQGRHRNIGEVTQVKVIGRPPFTNSENAREELIHDLLTGRKTLLDSVLIRLLWFPGLKKIKVQISAPVVDPEFVDDITAQMSLNESQRRVVRGMVGDIPILVAHGPPGTGKTTTIAAASRIWDIMDQYVWIVAHSNVAVKNIAETLFKKEVDFKLLVSKEFFQEWHEHLYDEIKQRVIRSDELPKDTSEMAKIIGNSCIILCTLSMLSNPALRTNGMFRIVPVERLIIDEASQINIFEFIRIFKHFQQTLQKVCFFGDPEQLPPFGQDKVQSIQTIFDLAHITRASGDFFLDTQYRMPAPIGHFISREMYNNRLKSRHRITDPQCVKFIDVSPPRAQEVRSGFSWTNPAETMTIVNLIKNYYKNMNFCVITPYDAQRAAIERALKSQDLPWESVYNLDSFQGNEADYLLISVVRTGMQPGFLTSRKRMNVLLTRCRKAAIIVTSKVFMGLGGTQTLLGRMLSYWERIFKVPEIWVDWSLVADGRANLPDAPGLQHTHLHTSHMKPVSVSYQTTTTSKWPSTTYQSPCGFSVSSLYQGFTESFSFTNTRSGELIAGGEQAYPPLGRSKEPILQGSWKKFNPPSNTIHEYSLLRKALKGITTTQAENSQVASPSQQAPVNPRRSYASVASLQRWNWTR